MAIDKETTVYKSTFYFIMSTNNGIHHLLEEGFPHSSVGKESACNAGRRPWFHFWVGKIHWGRDRLPIPVFLGFPGGSAGKESACNVGDLGLIPGLGRSPGEGNGYPLQYSGLENSMDYTVHGVTKSWTQLSNFHKICVTFGPIGMLITLIWLSVSATS